MFAASAARSGGNGRSVEVRIAVLSRFSSLPPRLEGREVDEQSARSAGAA